MAELADLPVGHATLVGGTHCHPQCGEPKETTQKIHTSFLSWQLDVRPSQAKSTSCPFPPNVSPGICFPQ